MAAFGECLVAVSALCAATTPWSFLSASMQLIPCLIPRWNFFVPKSKLKSNASPLSLISKNVISLSRISSILFHKLQVFFLKIASKIFFVLRVHFRNKLLVYFPFMMSQGTSNGTSSSDPLSPSLPPGVTPNYIDPPNHTQQLIIFNSICMAIATIAVAMRIYTRAFVTHTFGKDDCRLSRWGVFEVYWCYLDAILFAWVG